MRWRFAHLFFILFNERVLSTRPRSVGVERQLPISGECVFRVARARRIVESSNKYLAEIIPFYVTISCVIKTHRKSFESNRTIGRHLSPPALPGAAALAAVTCASRKAHRLQPNAEPRTRTVINFIMPFSIRVRSN